MATVLGLIGGLFRGAYGIFRAWGKNKELYFGYAAGSWFFSGLCGAFTGLAFGTLALWAAPFAGFIGMDLLENLVKFITKQNYKFTK